MKFVIDGYNLLQASGLFATDRIGTLEGARRALLDHLVAILSAADAKRTTVVFDAAYAPPGLPSELHDRGIRILFSRRNDTADELIEALVEAEADPRHLTVVSSDHRLQRAARRRRAMFIDSDIWLRDLRRASTLAGGSPTPPGGQEKPSSESLSNPFPPNYVAEVQREADQW